MCPFFFFCVRAPRIYNTPPVHCLGCSCLLALVPRPAIMMTVTMLPSSRTSCWSSARGRGALGRRIRVVSSASYGGGDDDYHCGSAGSASKVLHSPLFPLIAEHKSGRWGGCMGGWCGGCMGGWCGGLPRCPRRRPRADSLSARCESSKVEGHHSPNRRIVITHALAETAESAVIADKSVGRVDEEEMRQIGDRVRKTLAGQSVAGKKKMMMKEETKRTRL